jgi:hypothetical protein
MRLKIAFAFMFALLVLGAVSASDNDNSLLGWEGVEETYTLQVGETLDLISCLRITLVDVFIVEPSYESKAVFRTDIQGNEEIMQITVGASGGWGIRPDGQVYEVTLVNLSTDAKGDFAVIKIKAKLNCESKTEINIDPDTLNLRSRGKWITAYIEFPVAEVSYAKVGFVCWQWNDIGGGGYYGERIIYEGETSTAGCGNLTLIQVNNNEGLFRQDFKWSETFTLLIGESKYIHWGEIEGFNYSTNITLLDIFTGSGDVMDIDVDTVKLEYNGKTVYAENNPRYGFVSNPQPHDEDGDGIPEFMVKFDRSEVQKIVDPGMVTLTVSGQTKDGNNFSGTDTVRVIGNILPIPKNKAFLSSRLGKSAKRI